VAKWKAELLPGLGKANRPFTVGHAAFPVTHLPARDGIPHGNVQRSASAPNCSYFTHWTSTEDSVSWSIDVLQAGNFEVELYYACPESDVGTELELSIGSSRLQTVIEQANDPPAVGAEHDRVPRRAESLVKDFKPLAMGTIPLSAGTGELILRPTRLMGEQMLDVRLLLLRRVR
jgi:hypothetical protein